MADLLSIGKSGLFASRKSLETTGHNISNANTEGYSRQRVNQTSNMPHGIGGMIMGTGTRIASVTRFHDQLIERRLNKTLSSEKYFNERGLQLEQLENIFNEVDSEGLNQLLTKFYNSFRELAAQPENETIRSVVRDNANLVVKDFRRIRETLNSISKNIDKKMKSDVIDINQILKTVAKLNKQITSLEAGGSETGDLRDQRDLAIRNLSEFFNVVTYIDDKNHHIVNAKGVGTLVSAGMVQELAIGTKNKEESSNNMAGSAEIYMKGSMRQAKTLKFSGGSLSSSIAVRNTDIARFQKEIDTIAYELTNTVNAVHRRGYTNRTVEIDASGTPVSSDAVGPTTGINFFKDLAGTDNASGNIALSDEVSGDLRNVVTALDPNSPGDNRISLALSKLQHEKVFDNGTATLEEKYLQVVGNVGLQTGKARFDADQAQGIVAQVQSIKERLSGVSLDEEAANMVRFQHAYDASAKVLKTADEMFKTILAVKR